MKKIAFAIITLVLSSSLVQAETGSIYLNVSNGLGLGTMFQKDTGTAMIDGVDNIYEARTYDGFGFQLGMQYNLTSRIGISLGWGLNSGNSKYEHWPVGEAGSKTRTNYYFRFWSANLRASYKLLILENGWEIVPFLGMTYNKIQKDDKPLFLKDSFTGIELGMRFNYRIMENWGWHLEAAYDAFLSSGGFKRLRLATGISFHI
jgi:hypothetical protein